VIKQPLPMPFENPPPGGHERAKKGDPSSSIYQEITLPLSSKADEARHVHAPMTLSSPALHTHLAA
jgi:hypothetical protein